MSKDNHKLSDEPLFPGLLVIPERSLPGLRRRWLVRELLNVGIGDDLNGEQCLIAWLYQLLSELPWLSPEAAQLIVREARDDLAPHGARLGRNHGLPAHYVAGTEAVTLAFAELKFVTWTDCTGWLSLETGQRLSNLPVTPLETIGYNLPELFRRNYNRCRAGHHANAGKHADLGGVPSGLD